MGIMNISREKYRFSKYEYQEDSILEYVLAHYPSDSVMSMCKIIGAAGEGYEITFSRFES